MDPITTLPKLLGIAWLLPLASFTLILFFGPRMGKAGSKAGYLATAAILTSCALSLFALFFVWLPNYALPGPVEHRETADASPDAHAASETTGHAHDKSGHETPGGEGSEAHEKRSEEHTSELQSH